MKVPTVIETMARFGSNPSPRAVSPEVEHHAKRAVLDWFAAALPGSVVDPCQSLERALADDLDRGKATLVLGRPSTTRTAALINGTAAHTVEVDDIFKDAIYHPGAPTIASARAVAQEIGADGRRFLLATIVGYEISTRIGTGLGRAHYRYWHNTGTVGAFGAAAAAAVLYRLDAQRFAHALATVATFAAGLQQAFRMDSMSKPLHAGRAAEAGVLAAQLAREGVTGSLDVIDGQAGLGRAMSDGPNWPDVMRDLGENFNITRMTFKNHACCGHTFAPIDGLLELRRSIGFDVDDVRAINIATYAPALEVAGNTDPKTAAEARFSIPFVVATALLHGSVRLAAFTPERLADVRLRQVMERISLSVAPELDANFPEQRAARVTIDLHDGQHHEFLQPCRKGDPEAPLDDGELDAKFRELAEPVIGSEAAAILRSDIWSIESGNRPC